MITRTLAGQAWHVHSPSRYQLADHPQTCLLAYCGRAAGWQILSSVQSPIACPDRDTGARWLALALALARARESTNAPGGTQ